MRRERGLLQRDVAELIGVQAATVVNWEKNKTERPVTLMPAVIRFLGYEPWPEPVTLGARMTAYRRHHGLSIREAAKRAQVDAVSWSTWERTGVISAKQERERVERVIAVSGDSRLR